LQYLIQQSNKEWDCPIFVIVVGQERRESKIEVSDWVFAYKEGEKTTKQQQQQKRI